MDRPHGKCIAGRVHLSRTQAEGASRPALPPGGSGGDHCLAEGADEP